MLAALHGVHALLVALNVLAPRLHVAGGGLAQAWSIIALNAMNVAIACRCRQCQRCCLLPVLSLQITCPPGFLPGQKVNDAWAAVHAPDGAVSHSA